MFVSNLAALLLCKAASGDQNTAWQNEPRNKNGEWTSGGAASTGTKTPHIPSGVKMPRTGFVGVRGHSDWVSNDATIRALTGGRAVAFRNGFPRFEPFVPRVCGLKGVNAENGQ